VARSYGGLLPPRPELLHLGFPPGYTSRHCMSLYGFFLVVLASHPPHTSFAEVFMPLRVNSEFPFSPPP